MRILRPTALAAVLYVLAASSVSAFNAESQNSDPGSDPGAEARELALDSIEKLMRAMDLLLDSIPQYEAPEITDDGDIIIRRKRDPDEPENLPEQDTEQRET
ncbi:hypothetical protein [Algihabitans albus]|uniref:hypothetical protein n=1 Tax=Algihabitans albus TaxID=2164067 RepID=UPI0013C33A87|nr:hypothetical protein [Algihabitans albus]